MAAPSSRTIVVVVGGAPTTDALRVRLAGIEPDATTVAADSGIDLALALGRHVDVAVGDFDSVTREGLAAVTDAGAEIVRHPAAKDATDLELALDVAVDRGAERLVVLGGHGGRLDHLLANVALLAAPRYAGVEVVAHVAEALVTIVRGERTLGGVLGELVTLLPQHGPAEGVTTTGLAYPLREERLVEGTSRGVSNVFTGREATVHVRDGAVAAIQPDHHRLQE